VLDEEALRAIVGGVLAEHGRLDAVVHAAQVMAYGRIEDVPRDVFERVVDTAIHGTANVARIVLPVFRQQGRGHLVIVNSLLGEIPTPGMGAYDAGKWGQRGLAEVLRLETLRDADIHVGIVSPGAINTPIYDAAANYAERGGFPPPLVIDPVRVADAILRMLDRPHRHAAVGPLNTLVVTGYRLMPAIYERLAGPLVRLLVFRGAPNEGNPGNVFSPTQRLEAERGRWTVLGRPRR
jgi:NAD(P)-dependent dehydrogenase (short-subunit alcohol dehydrogenase family)